MIIFVKKADHLLRGVRLGFARERGSWEESSAYGCEIKVSRRRDRGHTPASS